MVPRVRGPHSDSTVLLRAPIVTFVFLVLPAVGCFDAHLAGVPGGGGDAGVVPRDASPDVAPDAAAPDADVVPGCGAPPWTSCFEALDCGGTGDACAFRSFCAEVTPDGCEAFFECEDGRVTVRERCP